MVPTLTVLEPQDSNITEYTYFLGFRGNPGGRTRAQERVTSPFLGLGGNLKEGGTVNCLLTADPVTTGQPIYSLFADS